MTLDELIGKAVEFFDPKSKALSSPPKRTFPVPSMGSSVLDLTRIVQPCDIVLYRFTGVNDFLGGVISDITSSPYSHAEFHAFNLYTIEAGAGGVGFSDLYRNNVLRDNVVDIFRLNRPITREERLVMQAKAYQSLLSPYDYVDLVTFPFRSAKDVVNAAGNHAYICSEEVDWIYQNAGIELNVGNPTPLEAPADIGRSSILNYMGTFKDGNLIPGNWRNQFLDFQKEGLGTEIVAALMKMFSIKDEYYAGLRKNNALVAGKD